ncbi:MAG: MFS transporter [Vulcanimicrobiaceae bacterium]
MRQLSPAGRRFWVLLATVVGSSMVFVDGTVVTLALPAMQEQFHASASDAQWIVEAYAIALGSLMLLGGSLGDRYGRRRVFIVGVIIFTLASIACGLAANITMAILARVAQGVGGMLLAPASLALLGAHFSGQERGKAVGTWSAMTAVATTIGPVLGGVLIDHFSWRAVFYINVPLALLVLAATFYAVDESRDEGETGPLDIAGSLLVTLGMVGIVYALIVAPLESWHSLKVQVAFFGGLIALAIFPFVERHARNPIVPLELFRSSTFAGVNALTLLLYAALGGLLYFLPFLMIQVGGYSATATGAAFLPFILILFVLSRPAGAMLSRVGPKAILTTGTLVTSIGFIAFAMLERNGSYWTSFFPAISLLGLGMGITVAPLTTTVMDAVPSDRIGVAAGINNAVSRIAGMLAIAGLGAVLWSGFSASLDRRLEAVHVPPAQRAAIDAQRGKLAAARFSDPSATALVHAAYADGFALVAYCCAGMSILSSVISLLSIRGRDRQT